MYAGRVVASRFIGWCAQGTVIAGLTICIGGCKELPDEIPYEFSIYAEESPGLGDRAIGGRLLADGKLVATFQRHQDKRGRWKILARGVGPKEEFAAVQDAKFVVEIPGPCEPLTIPLGRISEPQKSSDHDTAAEIEKSGYARFVLSSLPVRPFHEVIVDWGGDPEQSIKVGDAELGPTELVQSLPLVGCEESPRVVIGGEDVGELNLQAPVHLLSTRKDTCYGFLPINYTMEFTEQLRGVGLDPSISDPKLVSDHKPFLTRGQRVIAVPVMPDFKLEPAMKEIRSRDEEILYELRERPCRGT